LFSNPNCDDPAQPGPKVCKYGDTTCPCPDGDPCHYEGKNPMTAQKSNRDLLAQALGMLEYYREQTRPIALADVLINEIRLRLEKP
jgi:hypothetical protein